MGLWTGTAVPTRGACPKPGGCERLENTDVFPMEKGNNYLIKRGEKRFLAGGFASKECSTTPTTQSLPMGGEANFNTPPPITCCEAGNTENFPKYLPSFPLPGSFARGAAG